MGLDLSHCNAQWAYLGFKRFREVLWSLAGFKGNLYELYDRDWPPEGAEAHPLWPLFNHSDCDGILTVEEMKRIEPELSRLMGLWPTGDVNDEHDHWAGEELCRGMRRAIELGECMQFR